MSACWSRADGKGKAQDAAKGDPSSSELRDSLPAGLLPAGDWTVLPQLVRR